MLLTNLCEGGYEDPECDDEGDLHPVELDMEDVVLRGVAVAVGGGVVAQPVQGVLTIAGQSTQSPSLSYILRECSVFWTCHVRPGRVQSIVFWMLYLCQKVLSADWPLLHRVTVKMTQTKIN